MTGCRFILALLVVLRAIPTLAEEPLPESHKAAAYEAYLAGDYGKAKSLLGNLAANNPRDPDLLRRIAAVEAAMGDLDEAQATIDRAMTLAPQDGDIQLARANILLWRKQDSEAERQADDLASARPDYPGLDQFRISLRAAQEARKLRFRKLSVGGSVSDAEFASGSRQTWYVQRGSASVGWGEGAVASLEVEREDRLLTDTRIASLIDVPIGSHRAFLSGSVTPNADFRESWSLKVGANIALGPSDWLLVDGRNAGYASGDVSAIGIGLRHSFAQNLSLTARSTHLFGGGEDYRLGGVVRADYDPANRPGLFLIAASYPDTEADGTRQLRSVAAGARFPLSSRVSLNLIGEHDSRKNSYDRTAISVDLAWNYGGGR